MANKFQQATPEGAAHTETNTWITPKWVIDKIGISDLDPCGWLPSGNAITETAHRYYTKETDGLRQPWACDYKTIFVNFPYSDSYKWLKKCHEEAAKGAEIIVLCFARTETKAWAHFVKSATGINFITRRIKFLTGEGIEKTNGNAPSCLIAWGENAYTRIKNIDGIYVRIDNN
jgi:phage N-6-adenine-methyltransferase